MYRLSFFSAGTSVMLNLFLCVFIWKQWNNISATINQIQLRGFRSTALGTLFPKMTDDLMTIWQ